MSSSSPKGPGLPADLRLAILLVLAEAPGHGYDLPGRLSNAGFPAWPPGRMYPALHRLEAAGLVLSALALAGGRGPARRVYRLTPQGKASLAERIAGRTPFASSAGRASASSEPDPSSVADGSR